MIFVWNGFLIGLLIFIIILFALFILSVVADCTVIEAAFTCCIGLLIFFAIGLYRYSSAFKQIKELDSEISTLEDNIALSEQTLYSLEEDSFEYKTCYLDILHAKKAMNKSIKKRNNFIKAINRKFKKSSSKKEKLIEEKIEVYNEGEYYVQ